MAPTRKELWCCARRCRPTSRPPSIRWSHTFDAAAWASFDPTTDTSFTERAERTHAAIDAAAPEDIRDGGWAAAAGNAIEHWPLPLIELKLTPDNISEADLLAERDGLWVRLRRAPVSVRVRRWAAAWFETAWIRSEYGNPYF